MSAISNHISPLIADVENALDGLLPPSTQEPSKLHNAMRHSLLGPAKRVRAALLMLACEELDGSSMKAVTAACAMEMIHAASLILDDMPAMDDANLRRGKEATHVVFGEATALLASIGLLNLAYDVMAKDDGLSSGEKLFVIRSYSDAVGSNGLIAGQQLDLLAGGQQYSNQKILKVHHLKTGTLFASALEVGASLGGGSEPCIEGMKHLGAELGGAFQTLDDALDVLGSEDSAEKSVGIDGCKPTLVRSLGAEAAIKHAEDRIDDAIDVVSAWVPKDGKLLTYVAALRAKLIGRLSLRVSA